MTPKQIFEDQIATRLPILRSKYAEIDAIYQFNITMTMVVNGSSIYVTASSAVESLMMRIARSNWHRGFR